MTKEKLELMIENVLLCFDDMEKVKKASEDFDYYRLFFRIEDGLDQEYEEEDIASEDSDYYRHFFGIEDGIYEGYGEEDIAIAVSEYPELHSKMIAIVDRIVAAIRSGEVYSMWSGDETQAGELISFALAMYDKKYCYVYAKSLLYQDREHEVYQNEEIMALIEKWGFCKEVGLVLAANVENASTDEIEFLDEYDGVLEVEMKNSALEFLINEYGGGICFANQLFEHNTKNLSLLIKAVNFCDDDRLEMFEYCEYYLRDSYFPENGITPEILELLVCYLLRSKYGEILFENLERMNPYAFQIMQEKENCNLFLEDIVKWINSDFPAAKERREDLLTRADSFVKKALTKAFKIVFTLDLSEAEKAARKYIEIYKNGAVPTSIQIVG